MSFSAKDVMALRQKTGLGMLDCKKALTENDGDLNAAEEWLREKLKGKMETRTERATGEGRIGILISGDDAVMVEIQTETDFTAKNDAFVAMVEAVTALAMKAPPGDVACTPDMQKAIDDQRITTGENVNFARGLRLHGGHFGSYLHHDGKRSCLLQVSGRAPDDVLKGICQHIVFHDPAGISEDDVPADKIETIRAEAVEEAKATGKPEQIAQRMAEGRVRKYLEENTLLHQKYVLDESQAIKDVLPKGVTITRFARYTLGA
ncbi:MAG: translation elongation factor Ts [Phycisphaerales bacterium]|nr:translation elongation factor Ts [Phycisphaerales bacterium]